MNQGYLQVELQANDDELRTLMLDAVGSAGNVEQLYELVAGLALNRRLTHQKKPDPRSTCGILSLTGFALGQLDLSNADKMRVRDAFYDLLVDGIVRPGMDWDNKELPHFRLTKVGKRLVEEKSPSPFDHDGYLTRCRNDIENLDPVIVTYLAESLRTFRIGCYLASTVTLGCAAEKALLLLMESTADALQQEGDAFRAKIAPKMMRGKFEEFQKILDHRIRPALKQTNRALDDFLDVQLNGIFEIIRSQRNSAGHPEGVIISHDMAHSNLYAFVAFLRRVYALIDWLKSKPTI